MRRRLVLGEGGARACSAPTVRWWVRHGQRHGFASIGVAGPQAVPRATSRACRAEPQQRAYVPTGAAMLRLEDNYSQFRDEMDGVYLASSRTPM